MWQARAAELLPGPSGAVETPADAPVTAAPPVVPVAAGWDATAEAY
ncbi:hypothetical protein [Kitasatospora griseola]